MPRKSKLNLPPLNLGTESLGQRIARLRKQRGYTQTELAQHIGITQDLVSAYELGKLGMQAEMVIRFAQALKVHTDELLGLEPPFYNNDTQPQSTPSLKLMRRINQIQTLPSSQQKILLRTIDMLIKAAQN